MLARQRRPTKARDSLPPLLEEQAAAKSDDSRLHAACPNNQPTDFERFLCHYWHAGALYRLCSAMAAICQRPDTRKIYLIAGTSGGPRGFNGATSNARSKA